MWDVFANQSENFDSFATHSLLSLANTLKLWIADQKCPTNKFWFQDHFLVLNSNWICLKIIFPLEILHFCEQLNFDNFEFSKVCTHVLSALWIILVKIYEKKWRSIFLIGGQSFTSVWMPNLVYKSGKDSRDFTVIISISS